MEAKDCKVGTLIKVVQGNTTRHQGAICRVEGVADDDVVTAIIIQAGTGVNPYESGVRVRLYAYKLQPVVEKKTFAMWVRSMRGAA